MKSVPEVPEAKLIATKESKTTDSMEVLNIPVITWY